MKLKFLCVALLPFASCFWFGNQALDPVPGANIRVKDTIIPAMTDTIFLKDINNDKIDDTAFVYTPPTLASLDEKGNIGFQMGCVDRNCYNTITFSCALPEIRFEESVWGFVENAGDLNGDGVSELLFEPGWFTSSMGHIYLYTLKNGKWEINTRVTHRRYGESLLPYLIKKGRHYYLQGVNFWDDDKPYLERIKLK